MSPARSQVGEEHVEGRGGVIPALGSRTGTTTVLRMPSSWDGTAEAYDASFGRLCAGTIGLVVAALGPASTEGRLLDVGSGPGALAAAARRAGFAAIGVDADESMVRLARRQHSDITFVRGALPNLPFRQAAFDAVAANFVVNHTPDPRASLRELSRVSRPGGRLAVTIWTGVVSPMNQLWHDVMSEASVQPPPSKTLPSGKDFERTADGLAQIVTAAGLDDVTVREVHWLFCISSADLWQAVVGGIATIGQTYRAQDRVAQRKMRDAYSHLVYERYPDGDLQLPSTALMAVARRSGRPLSQFRESQPCSTASGSA